MDGRWLTIWWQYSESVCNPWCWSDVPDLLEALESMRYLVSLKKFNLILELVWMAFLLLIPRNIECSSIEGHSVPKERNVSVSFSVSLALTTYVCTCDSVSTDNSQLGLSELYSRPLVSLRGEVWYYVLLSISVLKRHSLLVERVQSFAIKENWLWLPVPPFVIRVTLGKPGFYTLLLSPPVK